MGLMKQLRTWFRVPVPFRAEDYALQELYADDYRLIAASLLEELDFDSVIDLGCANGLLLLPFHEAGKKVRGIELSPNVSPYLPSGLRSLVAIGDFSAMDGRADLVCCMEMAEHLQPTRSEELVDKLTTLARKWIYFTAAPPGQGGRGHINCRPMAEWIGWFAARGWRTDQGKTVALASATARLDKALWLHGNSVILRAEAGG
jgi:hypothetical protein